MKDSSFEKLLGGLTLLCLGLPGFVSAREVLPQPDAKFKGIIGQTP